MRKAMSSVAPEDISKVECPYFRLIWDMGYSHFEQDIINHEYVLYGKSIGQKRINMWEFDNMAISLTVKGGVMKDSKGVQIGKPHYWISDGDGSAHRFREFLKPDKQPPLI